MVSVRRFIRDFTLFVLACQLVVFRTLPAFAGTASASDWVVGGSDFETSLLDVGEVPVEKPLEDVSTTADYRGIQLLVQYYDMSGNLKNVYANVDKNYYASLPRPDDCASVRFVQVRMNSISLPHPGTYAMKMKFSSNTGVQYSRFNFGSDKKYLNASTEYGSLVSSSAFDQYSGDWSCAATVDIGSVNVFYLTAWFKSSSPSVLPYGGYVSVSFSKSSATPDYTTVGGPQTSEDVQQDISNNTSQIASNTAQMGETLKEIVQTISNQLHALWDQMFNYMHVPHLANDDKNTQRIIDRLDDGFDVNVEVLERNFLDLMANDDKNTDTVVNGYDNSGMNSSNRKLDGSVREYDKAETDVFDSVRDNVTGFELPEFTNSVPVLAAISFSSSYLQRLFDAVGLFNVPITVSLVMIFVLMVLGYYRVRS